MPVYSEEGVLGLRFDGELDPWHHEGLRWGGLFAVFVAGRYRGALVRLD